MGKERSQVACSIAIEPDEDDGPLRREAPNAVGFVLPIAVWLQDSWWRLLPLPVYLYLVHCRVLDFFLSAGPGDSGAGGKKKPTH